MGPIENWPQSLKSTLRLVLSSRQPMCFWWGDDLLQFHNDAYLPMLGKGQLAIGMPFKELWSDVWEDVLPFVRSALAGKGTWMENLPLTMTRNGYEEQTYFTFSYSPLYDDTGDIRGILNVVTETTQAMQDRVALERAYADATSYILEREKHEEELKLLNRELAHRMKNTLAMVQSIVSQTLRGASSLSDAASTISARIQTLAKAQDLLTGMSVTAAEVSAIANAAVAPHSDSEIRFHMQGPNVFLSAQQALGLSLAIHELATNATKYGALSLPGGRVDVSWARQGSEGFSFDWRESGGPPVSEPTRRGFGSRLTERVVSDLFKGEAKIRFLPDGVIFSLSGRLNQIADLDR
ncbi:PAS domain-containing sensor histidine kinase [Rhizobium sp. PDO1-076]|uniref:PAS domain-containing sensor histidine kinase n=1 Tax=Rhizobium sp. PDO1-076 TaxID=1125979 RepID=UPI001FCC2659|nr:PAS domain-containing sensor histidine kinase [Rhizobium sp. PDO1-076]